MEQDQVTADILRFLEDAGGTHTTAEIADTCGQPIEAVRKSLEAALTSELVSATGDDAWEITEQGRLTTLPGIEE